MRKCDFKKAGFNIFNNSLYRCSETRGIEYCGTIKFIGSKSYWKPTELDGTDKSNIDWVYVKNINEVNSLIDEHFSNLKYTDCYDKSSSEEWIKESYFLNVLSTFGEVKQYEVHGHVKTYEIGNQFITFCSDDYTVSCGLADYSFCTSHFTMYDIEQSKQEISNVLSIPILQKILPDLCVLEKLPCFETINIENTLFSRGNLKVIFSNAIKTMEKYIDEH